MQSGIEDALSVKVKNYRSNDNLIIPESVASIAIFMDSVPQLEKLAKLCIPHRMFR